MKVTWRYWHNPNNWFFTSQEKKISMLWTTETTIFIRMIARFSIQRKQSYLWFIEKKYINMKTQRRQLLFDSQLKHSWILSSVCNVNNQFDFTVQKLWFRCVQMKRLKTTIFSIETQMFKVFWQPIQPLFCNNIKRFTTLFVQIFRLRAHNYVYLIINITNTVKWTQSTLSLTGCRTLSTFDPFRTFHPSLHESVVSRHWHCIT